MSANGLAVTTCQAAPGGRPCSEPAAFVTPPYCHKCLDATHDAYPYRLGVARAVLENVLVALTVGALTITPDYSPTGRLAIDAIRRFLEAEEALTKWTTRRIQGETETT